MKTALIYLFPLFFLNGTLHAQDLVVPYSSFPPVCDGIIDENDPWGTEWISLEKTKGTTTDHLSAQFQFYNGDEHFYIAVKVQDSTLAELHPNSFENDCSELYFSMDTLPYFNQGAYKEGCWQFRSQRTPYNNDWVGYFSGNSNANRWDISPMLESAEFDFGTTDSGTEYIQEFILPKDVLIDGAFFDNQYIRFDVEVSDNTGIGRTGQRFWNSDTDFQWEDTRYFGVVKLIDKNIVLSTNKVDENLTTGLEIGTLSIPGENMELYNFEFSNKENNDQQLFTINGQQLLTNATFDYETKQSFLIEIKGTSTTGKEYTNQFSIYINNVPEIMLSNYSIDENIASGSFIGDILTAEGIKDTVNTFTMVGNETTDYQSFTLTENSLYATQTFNFEIKSSYVLLLQSVDVTENGILDEINIQINDENDVPSDLFLSKQSIIVDQNKGSMIGTFTTSDEDNNEAFVYAFISGEADTDNDKFSIQDDQLHLSDQHEFNLTTDYQIRIQTTDSKGAFFSKPFTISVVRVNETPTDIRITKTTIDENEATGTLVGILSTVDVNENDIHTYEFVTGDLDTNNESFQISGDQLLTNEKFDYETQAIYTVRIQTKDKAGATFSKAFLISVRDLEETSVNIIKSVEQLVKVYPNPVKNGWVNIENNSEDLLKIEVIGTDGRVFMVSEISSGKNQLHFEQLPSNVYVLKFSVMDGACFHKQIVKQ